MLSPEQIDRAGDSVAAVYSDIEAQMLDRLVATLCDGEALRQRDMTALALVSQTHARDLQAILDANAGSVDAAARETVTKMLRASDEDDRRRAGGPPMYPQQVDGTIQGVARILARDNIQMLEGAKQAFLTASMNAITQVNTGALTTEQALHRAVRELERAGIPIITYQNAQTGIVTVQNKVDVAVRRHVRTQIAQDGARMTLERLESLGVELVEVSSHEDARPSHAVWQGRVYSLHGDMRMPDGTFYPDFYGSTNYGAVDGLLGANCRHSFGPYRHGAPRAYEPNPQHESGLPSEEVYGMEQQQRHLERQIRQAKREVRGAQQVHESLDTIESRAELAKAQQRLKRSQANMREFIEESNAKSKTGAPILHRHANREWAGDMPKSPAVKTSGRTLNEFMGGAQAARDMQARGISKTSATAAMRGALEQRGIKTADFTALTASEQQSIWRGVLDLLPGNKRATAKASAGKHAAQPFTPAATIQEALDFAVAEFGIDRMGSMYDKIGIDGVNLINEGLHNVKQVIGTVNLRDIRYKASFNGKPNAVAAYNPSWNGLFFTKNIKGKRAAQKMEQMQQEQYQIGWWSNANRLGVVNHEMGHYAHRVLDFSPHSTVCDHYLELLLDRFRAEAAQGVAVDWSRWSTPGGSPGEVIARARSNGLSGYALTNTKELVAESFAQLYDGSVSDQAREVLKTLLSHAANINSPELATLKRRLEQL